MFTFSTIEVTQVEFVKTFADLIWFLGSTMNTTGLPNIYYRRVGVNFFNFEEENKRFSLPPMFKVQ